jgi:glycosyltransferase involved in cell wall biosynthesis
MVVPDLAPESGGPAENVPRLAQALAALGLQVELHWQGSPKGGGTLATLASAVESREARPAPPRRLGRSPEMLRLLRASKADLVHAHCLWMLPLGYAARAASTRGVPLVISPRGMLAPWSLQRSRWKKRIARTFLHRGAFEQAAGWHATSEQEANDIRTLGMDAPVCTAPNGIEPSPPGADAAQATYLQRAPELRSRRVLLFYSRFHSKKRVLELVRDFGTLAPEYPLWHLLAVGIPEEYSVERVRNEAIRLGIADRVTVLDGRGMPKPYALAELCVLPSHDENFGRVVAEALAAGVPVVTTTRTPWPGIATVAAGGWVPLEAIPAELARLMSQSPAELRAAGERGRQWVMETFDWKTVAITMARFYQSLLDGPRR